MPAMPVLPRSRLAPQGETIDLTVNGSESPSSVPPLRHPPQVIDLTMPNPVSGSPRDHMHAVVALLRPGVIGSTRDTSEKGQRRRVVENMSYLRQQDQLPPLQRSNVNPAQAHEPITTNFFQTHRRTEKRSMSSIPLARISECQVEVAVSGQQQARKCKKGLSQPFPFLRFPPEIRNCVYRMLLTTPKTPIEFPKPTGRNQARRAAAWEKCKTWKMRRRHKTIFLEILEVSKQLHAEASGILYGSNVFKYRSDYGKGPRPVMLPLPTRHLQLLKHIKLSVISGNPHIGQDQWVADLVKQFVKEGLRLETFEMTWFGWKPCYLRACGLVCQTLLCLDVERVFVIKVTGEARMDIETKDRLEQSIRSKRVEIHRPVKHMTGEELSDEDTAQMD